MEVENHHLALQVGELPHHALVVGQLYVYQVACHQFRWVYLYATVLHYPLVLHSLDGDVMKVLTAQRIGVIGVPTGCHGTEHLHVIGVLARVEDECVAQCLEQREIRIRLHRLLIDVVVPDFLLISIHHLTYGVFGCVDSHRRVTANLYCLLLQCHLLQRQFLYLGAVLRTLHCVVRSHAGILSLHGYRLCRVDADIDYLCCYAQAIELRGIGLRAAETESAVLTEFHRVGLHRSVKTHVLKIEHRVLGVRNVTVYLEFPFRTRCERHYRRSASDSFYNVKFHIVV